jgi:hypothetical protein
MTRRTFGAMAVAMALAGTTGCGLGQTAQEQAHDRLQDALDGAHAGFLDRRAHDPYSTGAAALETLDPYGYSVASRATGDTVALVRWISAEGYEEQFLGGRRDFSMGACIGIAVVAGSGGDDRGSVTTQPVDCPSGVETDVEGYSVDEVTTDLDGREDDVTEPPYVPPVCISGEPCTEGGG